MEHLYPHGRCLLWNSPLITWHVISDSIVALAYLCIAICLFVFARYIAASQSISQWAFTSFGTFIMACSLSHVMDAVVFWYPWYVIQGFVKTICAAASVSTAVVLVGLLRRFIVKEHDEVKEHPVISKDAPSQLIPRSVNDAKFPI